MAIFICLLGMTTMAQNVGKIKKGVPTFTGDASKMLPIWNNFLAEQTHINANLKSIQIIKKGNIYLMIARGNTYKSSIQIQYNSSKNIFLMPNNTCTCTTSACSSTEGCESLGTKCTPCNGDCVKSSTNIKIFETLE